MFYLKEIPFVIKKKSRIKIEAQQPRGKSNHSRVSIPHFNLKKCGYF